MRENMSNPNADDVDGNSDVQALLLQSQKVRTTIQNISELLNTGLNHETLDICVKLLEAGVQPQALAEIILQIRSEVEKLKNSDT